MRPSALLLASLVLIAGVVSNCARSSAGPTAARPSPNVPASTQTNVLRTDYAGSASCAPCHAKETQSWERSPMHRMTRNANASDVRTPFDGRSMHIGRDTVTLESHDGGRFVRITKGGANAEAYRVTRVIGGRTREDFAGVRVRRENDRVDLAETEELVLPISQLFFGTGTEDAGAFGPLRYKGYSVLVHERPGARAGPVWRETCIFCHNTVPLFSTVLGQLRHGAGPVYQAADVDHLLPPLRRSHYVVTDVAGFREAASSEIEHLGGAAGAATESTDDLLVCAISTTRKRFAANDLVEVGIGCEACHGGSKAHVEDWKVKPSLTPYAPFLGVSSEPGPRGMATCAHAKDVERVCVRCHQVLFTGYPWTWEGGRRNAADRGGSVVNSGEGRDFLLGGCVSALSCTVCHDPHGGQDRAANYALLETPAGNGVCTSCHSKFASARALREHAHHDPVGAGGACVGCHMPRKNMGLDLRLTRYHRIGSPTDAARVLGDRPLECALCHADKSVATLVATMETWWNRAYS